MSVSTQSTLILLLTPLAYLALGLWLLVQKRQPVTAGLVTLVIALMPVAWLFTLPSDEVEAPGTGILVFMLLVPITGSILLTLIGFMLLIIRQFRAAGLRKTKQGVTT